MGFQFVKMHGLGNDFAVLDARQNGGPDEDAVRLIADRRRGVGCDQVLVLEKPGNSGADLFMRIYNPDGGQAGACGNGTRCVARLFMDAEGRRDCVIETARGLLACRVAEGGLVEVDMGPPLLDWKDIPLAEERDTLDIALKAGALPAAVAVNMGNPHIVFFVDDVAALDIAALGPSVERHALFPERTNVEFAQVLGPGKIRMRVWERGAGITQACGSGACATIVAAVRRGLTERKAEIVLDGGSLWLEWRPGDGHVLMTGPAVVVYEGWLAQPTASVCK